MKKIILFLFLILNAFTKLTAQWFWQNPMPQGYNLNDVFILDENNIFAVGDASTFIETTDGGISWQIKNNIINDAHQLKSIFFINQQLGFVLASDMYNGWLLKTADGGDEWTSQRFDFGLNKIFFIDDNNGWIIGNVFDLPGQGKILRTTDGGNNWALSDFVIYNELLSVDFIDQLNGWVVGSNVVLNTSDGGLSWETINQDSLTFYSVDFIDQQTGWACGEGFISKTNNGGVSWVKQDFDRNLLFTSIKFIDELHGFAVSKSWLHPDIKPEIFRTTNGGLTWIVCESENNSDLFSISASSLSNIIIVGQGGTIIKSSDGLNWKQLSAGINNIYFHDILFINDRVGWILGFSNDNQFDIIYKTANSGNSWTEIYRDQLTNNDYSGALFFINENVGWAARSGKILKTINSGAEWNLQFNSSYYLHDIVFKDSLNGLAAGTGLLETTNGGVNWQDKVSPIQRITSIKLSGKDTVFIVGYGSGTNGYIYKSTDLGNNWSLNYTSGFRLLNTFIADEQNVWAYGTSSDYLQTTNGGGSWTVHSFPSSTGYVKSIFFINQETGWLLRDSGLFFKTNNGGKTWNTSSMEYPIVNDLFFIDENVGWMCGGNGAILHTTNGGGISHLEENKNIFSSNNFILSQNYPNPFNPNTTISYELPRAGKVSIKIFDLLGREITTLVDEYKNAGSYKVEFNASQLPSGVYFYRLQAGSFVETKKMILMK